METSHSVSSMRGYEERRFLAKALSDYHVREVEIHEISALEVCAAPVVVQDTAALMRAA